MIDIVDSSDDDEVLSTQNYFTLKHVNKESNPSTRPVDGQQEQVPEPSNFEGTPISKLARVKVTIFWIFLVVDNFALSPSEGVGDNDEDNDSSPSALGKKKNVE